MTIKNDIPLTTKEVESRLRATFAAPEYQIVFGVRNDAGFNATRTADAIAVGLWPSTGNLVLGFEIKVSRADWLRELKDPWKAEAIARFCDRWSVVLAKADIIRPEELPPGWGVYVPYGQRTMKCTIQPKPRTPEPMPRGCLAALVKRISEAPEANLLQRAINEARNEGKLDAQKERKSEVGSSESRLLALQGSVAEFEKLSGVKINEWGSKQIGVAVHLVIDLQQKIASLERTSKSLGEANAIIQSLFKEIHDFSLRGD